LQLTANKLLEIDQGNLHMAYSGSGSGTVGKLTVGYHANVIY